MRIGQRVIITNKHVQENFTHLTAEELKPIVPGATGTIVHADAREHEDTQDICLGLLVVIDGDSVPTVFFESDIAPLLEHMS